MDLYNIKIDLKTQRVFKFINGKKGIFDEVLSKISYNNKTINTQKTILDLEKSTLIIKYDLTIAYKVAKYVRALILANKTPKVPLSINISGLTINQRSYELLLLLEEVAPYVIIEVTETTRVDIKKLNEFSVIYKKIGGKIALDDFNKFSSICDKAYRLEQLDGCKPNFIKFVYPKKDNEFYPFYDFSKECTGVSPNSQLVYENIEHSHELKSILSLSSKSLVQGFLLSSHKPLLFELTIER